MDNREVIQKFVARLTSLYVDKKDIEADVAEVKSEMKDLGLDVQEISKVAAAIAADKVDDLVDTSQRIQEIAEIARS